ncbi:MAG TPA: ASCH domain-containing protein [Virgibacillus sp.]|nr:ASCH domain-containing protein [Virgibacillus sp.]HLR68673.1 ASCH domain-containing protein [Virgibacillus sp.]
MIHRMGLYSDYFPAIKKGKKTIEVRLNDEKRRKIKVGDIIEFIKVPQQDDKLKVEVVNLRRYATFKAMYTDISLIDVDCEGWTIKEMIDGTYDIYTPEQEEKWGTLAITIKYLSSESIS